MTTLPINDAETDRLISLFLDDDWVPSVKEVPKEVEVALAVLGSPVEGVSDSPFNRPETPSRGGEYYSPLSEGGSLAAALMESRSFSSFSPIQNSIEEELESPASVIEEDSTEAADLQHFIETLDLAQAADRARRGPVDSLPFPELGS